ncbi:MAG: hypothetical protein SF339_19770 [Blastocatellia bacterium]|nr:hypothetical protein [Blastocatellia bacterium]
MDRNLSLLLSRVRQPRAAGWLDGRRVDLDLVRRWGLKMVSPALLAAALILYLLHATIELVQAKSTKETRTLA